MNEGLRTHQGIEQNPSVLPAPPRKAGWTWHGIGAVFGFAGGFISLIFGATFTVISWLTGAGSGGAFLQRFGTILFLLTIPLLILGAHCLDLAEGKTPRLSLPVEARSGDAHGETDSYDGNHKVSE
ncbi:MAG: hypothetical protein H0U81_05050 [Pyrinomonadaceae bacterium]|nr:hypothetical protein [Pyrinomonadaceae bacterium]